MVRQVVKFNPNNDIDQANSDIAQGLRNLPTHESGTARILDVTIHSDFIITGLRDTKGPESTRPARDYLIKFLQDTYTQQFEERRIFRWLNDPIPVNDIGSIFSQWSQHLGRGDKQPYRLVNRMSLQQDPLDRDLHPRDSYLTCVQDSEDRLIGKLIICTSLPTPSHTTSLCGSLTLHFPPLNFLYQFVYKSDTRLVRPSKYPNT